MFFAYFTLQHKKLICLHLGLKLVFINKFFLYLKKYFQNWWDRMIQIKCNWLKIICRSGEAVFKKVQFTFYFHFFRDRPAVHQRVPLGNVALRQRPLSIVGKKYAI